MIEFREKNNCLIFSVRVVPRAAKSEIIGEYNEALKVKVAAHPIDNAANKELIVILAEFFGVSPNAVEITGGGRAKVKQVSVANANPEKLRQI